MGGIDQKVKCKKLQNKHWNDMSLGRGWGLTWKGEDGLGKAFFVRKNRKKEKIEKEAIHVESVRNK